MGHKTTTALCRPVIVVSRASDVERTMPSEVITAAVIVGGLVGGSILWAQRDRTVTTGWGRKDDKLMKALTELQQDLRALKEKRQ